ncbi:MAG: type II methionyl aminopeptidase [Promethearchaeia archaeon]
MNAKEKSKSKKEKKKKESSEKDEEEEQKKLESLKKAGDIAKKVKEFIKPKIQVGEKVLDIVEAAELKIDELGGRCAFPVNVSINNIAAHYTSPAKPDELTIKENDLVKLDLGVHIEGYIVDTAFSVNFNEDDSLKNIITATETAVDAAKMMAKPEIHTRKIGKKIEEIIKGFNYTPIKELGGHQLERWIVHAPKQLPNYGTQGGAIMEEGEVFAVEVFASTGEGSVHNTNSAYIYEMNPYAGRVPLRRKTSKKILGLIKKQYKTLPFAERWLAKEFKLGVAFGLQELVKQNKVKAHYVLSEEKDTYVAQSEETIIITEDGYEQLT